MRCITSALLLLRACAAATTSSSLSGPAHSSSEPSSLQSDQSSSTACTTSSQISTANSTSSLPAERSSPSTTAKSPLVFLPETTESVCPGRTVNYITHSLPQQCLRTSRSASGNVTATSERDGHNITLTTGTPEMRVSVEEHQGKQAQYTTNSTADTAGSETSPPSGNEATTADASKAQSTQEASPLGLEDEHDSPLDKSKFLSFEEWKQQNLEKVGQSPENVGQGRPQGAA